MPTASRRAVMSVRWRASFRGLALLTAAFTLEGCLSNEYRIQKDELRRLAEVAPEARGQSVRVSQTLGDRRSDAIEPSVPEASAPTAAPEAPSEPSSGDTSVQVDVGGGGNGRAGVRHDLAGQSPGRAFEGRPASAFHGSPSASGFHGSPGVGGGGFHASPSVGGGGFHGSPVGKGGFSLPGASGGGGGGNGGDVLVVLAVVAIVAATVATVALAASEGMRFEGHAEVAPEQLVYVKEGERTRVVPLLQLTREDAAAADSALVMDDEGYGMRRLDHARLDRKGGVFRFDLGAGMFTVGDARASGVSAHIQAGAYLTHTFGLVFDLGLGAGTPDPCCSGSLAATGTISRHSLGLEAQALPLGLGPLHLGAFAGGGFAITGAGGAYETGPLASAGGLLELDLTSHMALAVRGGASTAWMPSGQSSAGTLTGGLAIY
jgi:hypothetical protein